MIELEGLSVGYLGKPVLENVSLAFPPGKVCVLIGPNGSGKSTLLKAACGLLPKQAGTIRIDGAPLDTLSSRQIAQRVSFLAQSRSVPEITARRMVLHGRFPYLSYPRHYRKEDHLLVHQALERAGAAELADRSVGTLSGGQRQKVYVAMTLAQDCATVLMDEPTTYLDIAHQLRLVELARQLAGEGKAVVLVMHDLPLALHCGDVLAVLSEGRLVQTGTPEEIYQSGIISTVFGVQLHRVETQQGWQYYCLLPFSQ